MAARPRKLRPDPTPTTPDPIEIAMEAEAKNTSPDSPARRLLIKQEVLVGWQIASERAGFALKLLTGLAGLAAAVGLAWMAWTASRADGLVIKPFSVPPALAARGVTGEAVASQLLDQLSAMAGVSRGSLAQRRVSADQGDSISIEIPQTGISLSQLDQWLRQRLGHEVRITGEIIVQPDGALTLTSRIGSDALPPQAGPADEASALIVRAAEAIYHREQPINYVQYLERSDRLVESQAAALAATQRSDITERAMAWTLYGNMTRRIQGDGPSVFAYERSRAISINASPGATGNLQSVERLLGHAERAWRLELEAAQATDDNRTRSPSARRTAILNEQVSRARYLGDAAGGLVAARALAETQAEGLSGTVTPASLKSSVSGFLNALHEVAAAEALAEEIRLVTGRSTPPVGLLARATAREDWASAAAACDGVDAERAALPDQGVIRYANAATCALARARAGQLVTAEAAIAATPLDCQNCIVVRGQIAELKGQRATADHWFAEAVRMAPSLPQASYEWGKVLAARGDTDRAIAQFKGAVRRGPRYADAIEALGEALLAKGDAPGSIAKFTEAAKLTPRWGRLHLKWGQALARLGKTDEAKVRWQAAKGMDLTPTERAELARAQGAR